MKDCPKCEILRRETEKYRDFFDTVVAIITDYNESKEKKYDLMKDMAERLNIK